MFARLILVVTVLMTAFSITANAESLCGVPKNGKYDPAKRFGNVLGSCKIGKACVAFAAGRLPGAKKISVNLLLMQRKTLSAKWDMSLSLQSVNVDLSEGIEFVVDDKEPMRVPYEFLQAGEKAVTAKIDNRLNKILLEAFSAGKTMQLNVIQKDKSKGVLLFRINGLKDAIKWFDCAQKQ